MITPKNPVGHVATLPDATREYVRTGVWPVVSEALQSIPNATWTRSLANPRLWLWQATGGAADVLWTFEGMTFEAGPEWHFHRGGVSPVGYPTSPGFADPGEPGPFQLPLSTWQS